MKKTTVIIMLYLLGLAVLHAEVYSLFPFGKRGGGSSSDTAAHADALLSPKKFWNEKVTVNGVAHELGISLVDMPMRDAAAALKKLYPKVPYAANSNSILMEIPLGKDLVKRVYLLELPGIFSVLEFSMEVPAKRPKGSSASWPQIFPLLSGAEDITTMAFPARNADYGTFTIHGATAAQLFTDVTARLKASGWKATVEGDGGDLYSGTGGVFMSEKPLRMLILGVAETKGVRPGAKVTFYARPVE